MSSGFNRVVEDVVLDIETLPSYTDEVDTMSFTSIVMLRDAYMYIFFREIDE